MSTQLELLVYRKVPTIEVLILSLTNFFSIFGLAVFNKLQSYLIPRIFDEKHDFQRWDSNPGLLVPLSNHRDYAIQLPIIGT